MTQSASKSSVLIRADAGGALGAGHVMRMIALSQALLECGLSAHIATISCPTKILKRLQDEGIIHHQIHANTPGEPNDIEATITLAEQIKCRWIILDGYHFELSYQREVHKRGFKVAMMDDYGHCNTWCADLIINQNIGTKHISYQNEFKDYTELKGVSYALLRNEFRKAIQTKKTQIQHTRPRILITMGGVDQDNATGTILDAVNQIGSQQLDIKILIGAGNPHGFELRRLASQSIHAICFIENAIDMPSMYQWADGVISGGGSTCYEWLLFKCTGAIVTLADNQKGITNHLVGRDLALGLGDIEKLRAKQCAHSLKPWIRNLRSTNQPNKYLNIDPHGANRIIARLQNSPLWVREVFPDDVYLLFELANDKDVRENALSVAPIPWETHTIWFEKMRNSSNSFQFIAFDTTDQFAGQIRFDRSESSIDTWVITFSLHKDARGNKWGKHLIQEGLRRLHYIQPSANKIQAVVKTSNKPSLKTFRNLGFLTVSEGYKSNHVVFETSLPSDIPLAITEPAKTKPAY